MDAIVSIAVKKLDEFLTREAEFLLGVEEEVKWIRDELRYMQSFLIDADKKQDSDKRIRLWISDIRDIAFKTEDVLDTFYLEIQGTGTSKRGMLRTSVKKCFCISGKTDLYGIGKEIETLRKRVLDISRKREVYGINDIGSCSKEGTSGASSSILRELRKTTSYADEEHVVGFKDDTELLEEKLFQAEPSRSVVSILGMGGLGKTTLARKLYKNNSSMFDCHAWICVSQEWKTRDLLERIINSIKKELTNKKQLTNDELKRLEKMKDYDMEPYLRELLEGRRYLMVIDDVWQEEAWESLRRALPHNKNRSRVIITTRIQAVAELSDHRTYVHKLRFLRQDESWELFCKKAFPAETGDCPKDLEKLGKEMVAKCDGLPLAIIVLGGLLSRKQFDEWHTVKERIWRELKNKSIHVSSLLELSYNDLPHGLQLCFLYFGIFPEDFVINAEKLILLWIAEDFIPYGEERLDLEELAEIYLKELIGRSLIQVVEMNYKTISTCRVHDLLRDLAVSKAKELNFFHISDESMNSARYTAEASSARRIVFHSRCERYLSLDHSQKQVRTLSFLNTQDYHLVEMLCTRNKLLRVLELEGVGFGSTWDTDSLEGVGGVGFGSTIGPGLRLFEALGKLIHLRYLGLEGIDLAELPGSIGNLQALQTLYVSPSSIYRKSPIALPREICKLKQLRHLIGQFYISETRTGNIFVPPTFFGELTNLQSLKSLKINGWLTKEKKEGFDFDIFAKLRSLKTLSVTTAYNGGVISFQPLLNCSHLLDLKINAKLQSLPKEMYKFLPNLKYLKLSRSRLEEDPMPALEMLPNLLVLEFDSLEVKNMTCTATGFPQLEVFMIVKMSDVTKFQVEEGAMPRLKFLTLGGIDKKLSFPERLRSLPEKKEYIEAIESQPYSLTANL